MNNKFGMFGKAILIALLVCSLMLLGYVILSSVLNLPTPEEAERYKEEQKNLALRNTTKEIQAHLIFFRDERSGLCFAYYWGGMGNGGPALTLVPEEKVSKFLVK